MSPGPGSARLAGALSLLALALASTADAQAARPHLSWAHCSPAARCPRPLKTLRRGWNARIAVTHVSRRARIVLHVRPTPGHRPTRFVHAKLVRRNRLIAKIPASAVSGRLRVYMPGHRWSNALVVRVRTMPVTHSITPGVSADATPFAGNGMWIWYLSKSQGGSAAAIGAQARAHHVSTVFVKSSDGTSEWSQFSPSTVAALKAQGLHVCAWQFVYGASPIGEARAGADAAADGAECLVIDAETAYEGRYSQAQRYMRSLRARVGPSYPLALTSFPYVDYHPGLPYSVFLGPGAATYNLPQVYWKDIGDPVASSLAHTYEYNQPYDRVIAPLGQIYNGPRSAEVLSFRRLSDAYGAPGVSWWDWQEATPSLWNAVGAPVSPLGYPLAADWPALHRGSAGDLVVWLQEHLDGAGQHLAVDGEFGAGTRSGLLSFQTQQGLEPTGVTDQDTWEKLLSFTPTTPTWTASAAASVASAGRRSVTGPKSARLPARRDEVPGGPRRAPRR